MRKNFGARLTIWLLWALFGISLSTVVWYAVSGVQTISLLETWIAGAKLSLAVRVDALSSTIFCMVSFLAAMIAQYALRYLDGEPKQTYFYQYLLFTVTAVSLLILSSNLAMFFVAWLGISWGLHKLLVIYQERPKALLAARKKLLVSRLGDVALLLAVGLLYRAFGTFDFHDIFEIADHGMGSLSKEKIDLINMAGVLLAAGAMTKSAQFPFHFWLPETMETPTPVSALMHAGVINAGGFLVIRLSPVFAHAAGAGMLLTIAGAVTAVYGSLVMITQNNIKQKLAYSTISQMGMMMFGCGIGAYSVALFHIVAHSLYKAYAFLSTGALVAERTKLSIPLRPWPMSMALLCSILCGSLVFLGIRVGSGFYLPTLTYGAVLLLGMIQNMNLPRIRDAFGGFLPLVVGTAVFCGVAVYLAIEHNLGLYIASEIATPEPVAHWYDPIFLVNLTGYVIFAAGFCLSNVLLSQKSSFAQRLYIYLWNGGYFGHHTTRALLRFWPV